MIQTSDPMNVIVFFLDGWIDILLLFLLLFSVIPLYGNENAMWIYGMNSTNVLKLEKKKQTWN